MKTNTYTIQINGKGFAFGGHTYITQINGKWYAFEGNTSKKEVLSIGKDNPTIGRWFAKWTDEGIQYVATFSPSKDAAIKKAKRNGEYNGEV